MASNTAERWWVRLGARWLARINGVSAQLRLAMLGLTGISTATITLKQYGHGDLAWPFIAVIVGGTVGYAYLFGEGGVWNQVERDRADMSDNYSGPTMLIDRRIEGRQLAHLGYLLQNGHSRDAEELADELRQVTDEEWRRMRDGVDIDEVGR